MKWWTSPLLVGLMGIGAPSAPPQAPPVTTTTRPATTTTTGPATTTTTGPATTTTTGPATTTTTGPATTTTGPATTTTTGPATATTTVPATATTGPATTAVTGPAGANSCTSGVQLTPASDLQAAFNAAPENTTFCLAAGIYRLSAGLIPKTGDVIWGKPGAVLNGSRLATTFERVGNLFALRGQTQEFAAVSYGECNDPSYMGCHRLESVFRDDVALWEVTSLGALRPGTFFFDNGGDTIYLADDPAGHKIEVAVSPSALIGYADYQHGVTVRGLTVEKFAASNERAQYAAIRAGHNWLIENNEIRLNSAAAVHVASGTVMRNNSLHHNGQYGFRGEPLTGLRVEENDIGFNNTAEFSANWDAGGSKILSSTKLVFRRNTVHDNLGPGLWTDTDNRDVLFEDNVLERNVGPGIFHEASADATIRNNTLRGNGTYARGKSIWYSGDIMLNDSKNTEIYGNDIEAGVNGISLVDYDRGSSAIGKLEIRNVSVHDNIVKLPSGGQTGLVGSRPEAFSSAGNSFFRNTYYFTDAMSWVWSATQNQATWQAGGRDVDGVFLVRSK